MTDRAHLCTPANAAIVATEGDTLVLDDDVPQVFVGLADVHALDGLGRLTGVLMKTTNVHKQSQLINTRLIHNFRANQTCQTKRLLMQKSFKLRRLLNSTPADSK